MFETPEIGADISGARGDRSGHFSANVPRAFITCSEVSSEAFAPCTDVSARRVCSLRRSASVALRVEGAVKR